MAKFIFKMPDVGEGVAEAEVVEWHVKIGDRVEEDQHLVDVMTDKATIDIESPVAGTVVEVAGEVGDVIAIGSMLLVIEVEGAEATEAEAEAAAEQIEDDMSDAPEKPLPLGERVGDGGSTAEMDEVLSSSETPAPSAPTPSTSSPRREGEKVLASPAVRQRARDLGIDLAESEGGR